MNDGDLLIVELGNLAFAVVNTKHVNFASLTEENFILGWIWRVYLFVNRQAGNLSIVSASKDK